MLSGGGRRCSGPGATRRPLRPDEARGRSRAAASECPRQPGTGGTHSADVDFEQTREAYKSRDSLELLRSLVVFKLCSYDFLVDKNKEVMTRYLTLNT